MYWTIKNRKLTKKNIKTDNKNKTELESWRPFVVIWCLYSSICIMDLPALRYILVLHGNGLAHLWASPCWHRNGLTHTDNVAGLAWVWPTAWPTNRVTGLWPLGHLERHQDNGTEKRIFSFFVILCYINVLNNKCIGDDMKAAACLKHKLHKENKKIRRRTIFNLAVGILLAILTRSQ